ncbi:MAG: ribonuclease R [Gammaproteobacteria bacterium]|nr:ribonuclease R [Gammaproteobacteria bacterium]NNJ73185.1 ribonuclease R [Enterobacterales bacterium]
MQKFNPSKDPFLQREQKNYEKPVVSREYILDCLTAIKSPTTFSDLVKHFDYQDEELQELLRRRLRAMERDGQILRDRKNRYALISQLNLKRGKIQAHRDGYGFVIFDSESEDWYVSPRQMKKVFHGDEVLVRPDSRSFKGKTDAFIVRVLSAVDLRLVGRFHEEANTAFVIPEDPRYPDYIHVDVDSALRPAEGQVVVVDVKQRPTSQFLARGVILEILGDHLDPGLEIDIAIRAHDIPHEWPEEVLREVAELSADVSADDINGRVDLRDMPLVTIDGLDAKDFDDAVYCDRLESGNWVLWVAIADVSHYVRPHMALDEEAIHRGNSVYFPGQVVPMLPEVLSNGLCSLNPNVDRLCMICEMEISSDGDLQESRFYPSVMRSKARLTYDQVGLLFAGDAPIRKELDNLIAPLMRLHELYKTLAKKRAKRGAISFDRTESYIEFDDQRKIQKILPLVRNDAHRMIEECMIIANVATAEYFEAHNVPGVYRIHNGPSVSALEKLREYLASMGFMLHGDDSPVSADYLRLLTESANHPNSEQIQTMLLRSLSQAVYAPENEGHFGLALPGYSHFTSPIRRYPDLLAHRIIKARLAKKDASIKGSESGQAYTNKELVEACEQCSMTERRADDATRDVVAWLKCEFMLEHVGEHYAGRITSVAAFGIFVTLTEVDVEGMVHVTELANDYYHFDPISLTLTGERTNECYQVGDKVVIEVSHVSLDQRKIDFKCIEHDAKPVASGKTKKSTRATKPKFNKTRGEVKKQHRVKQKAGKKRPKRNKR